MAAVGVAPSAMEATDAASTADAPDTKMIDNTLEGSFTWTVTDYSKIREKMHYSGTFVVGGYNWRVLMFPRGNNADFLSLYLDVLNPQELPYQWSRYASFKLMLRSNVNEKLNIVKDANHLFNSRESDWGFTQFIALVDLQDPNKGYLVNDTLTIEAHVSVRPQENYYAYDSKKETGLVGLKNQGATCYMNSLLQTLFHIPYFRKAVYHMPTTEEDMPSKNIPLALQSLFYKVQYSDSSVSTKDLTRSFGWDANESFMQHDVQELNRVLCEKLEEKMKSTTVEGTIQYLFEGRITNYIECTNVEYKSTRTEVFQDLQLDVKGCKNVYESFDKYVEVEHLNGDNQYRAEGHGLQDAQKGVLFEGFPPVLELQLKRFEYDFQQDMMVKINERYEFPLELDLDRDNHKYLTPGADKSVRNLYHLHSVLVHSGGVHGGHYYAFIRPDLGDQWFKFDDERVTKEEHKCAIDDQFGGDDDSILNVNDATRLKYAKHSNAYMLVYVRAENRNRVLCPVPEEEIAPHLLLRFKKEQEEKERKKKEKAEAHLYTMVRVAREQDMAKQIGTDIFFDLIEHEKVQSFRVQKQTKFADFKLQVEQELGIPVANQRYWLWAKRQNHTYRPSRPLENAEDGLTLMQIKDQASPQQLKMNIVDLKLYLEEPNVDVIPRHLPSVNKGDILLFFKLYDPAASALSYVGKIFANTNSKVADLMDHMNEMAKFPLDQELLMFEEIKFEPSVMCEPIDSKSTLRSCQLEDGDIICFQRSLGPEEAYTYSTVPEFLDYVCHRQVVRFRKLEQPKEDELTLELSKQFTYTEVTDRLALELNIQDSSLLRLTAHNNYSNNPRPQPFKFNTPDRLQEMLAHVHQTTDILYYEVLDIPLPQLEELKILKFSFHNQKTEHVCDQIIRLPRVQTVEYLLNELKEKLKEYNIQGDLRLMEVCYSRIYKVFPLTDKLDSINDQYWIIRCEEITADDANMQEGDRLINVHHFRQDASANTVMQNFGEPFLLRIGENETMDSIKARVQAKLGTPDEEFAKWKFSFCTMGRPEPLTDADILSERFSSRRDWGGQWEHYLGLEHEDKGKRRPQSQSHRYSAEKAVKIWN